MLNNIGTSASEELEHFPDQPHSKLPQQFDPYEWQQSSPGVWTRTCIGQEASATFNENIADGHTELSMWCQFRIHQPSTSSIAGTQMELEELVARVRQAWIQTRYLRPELAVEMDRHADPTIPQTFKYRVLQDRESLREWVEQTFVVKRLGEPGVDTLEQLLHYTWNRPLPTKGKQSMLYLVLPRLEDQRDRCAQLIWNVSHAVTDGGSVAEFYNVLLQRIVDAAPSAPYDEIYIPSAFELDVLPRLPRSVVSAYRQQYKPQTQDVVQANKVAETNMKLVSDKVEESLALLPAASWTKRKHETICLVKTMGAAEAKQLLAFAKQVKSGVTYLASAACLLAMAETFPERKSSSKGALLGMVRNTRRWLCQSKPAEGPQGTMTPLGSDAVFLWIPLNTNRSLEPSYARLQSLIGIAGCIRSELEPHLLSPHCMASWPAVAEAAVSGLTEQWSQIERACRSNPHPSQKQLNDIVGPQAIGFSSIGLFKIHPRFEPSTPAARDTGLWLERTDAGHTGRQVNTSPWFSMLTIDGRIKFQLGFDTKFHEADRMHQLVERTFAWMQLCAAAAGTTTSSTMGVGALVPAQL